MWLFTTSGFYSATRSPIEPDKIQVRSRWEADLTALIERYLLGCQVLVNDDTDYRYRIIITRAEWADIVMREAEGIPYRNFKAACAVEGLSHERLKALSTIWAVLYEASQYDDRFWDIEHPLIPSRHIEPKKLKKPKKPKK